MSETCQCPAAGFCSRRNARIPNLHWRRCQSGQVEEMDHLYSVQPPVVTESAVGPRAFPAAVEGQATEPAKKCRPCSKRNPVK